MVQIEMRSGYNYSPMNIGMKGSIKVKELWKENAVYCLSARAR